MPVPDELEFILSQLPLQVESWKYDGFLKAQNVEDLGSAHVDSDGVEETALDRLLILVKSILHNPEPETVKAFWQTIKVAPGHDEQNEEGEGAEDPDEAISQQKALLPLHKALLVLLAQLIHDRTGLETIALEIYFKLLQLPLAEAHSITLQPLFMRAALDALKSFCNAEKATEKEKNNGSRNGLGNVKKRKRPRAGAFSPSPRGEEGDSDSAEESEPEENLRRNRSSDGPRLLTSLCDLVRFIVRFPTERNGGFSEAAAGVQEGGGNGNGNDVPEGGGDMQVDAENGHPISDSSSSSSSSNQSASSIPPGFRLLGELSAIPFLTLDDPVEHQALAPLRPQSAALDENIKPLFDYLAEAATVVAGDSHARNELSRTAVSQIQAILEEIGRSMGESPQAADFPCQSLSNVELKGDGGGESEEQAAGAAAAGDKEEVVPGVCIPLLTFLASEALKSLMPALHMTRHDGFGRETQVTKTQSDQREHASRALSAAIETAPALLRRWFPPEALVEGIREELRVQAEEKKKKEEERRRKKEEQERKKREKEARERTRQLEEEDAEAPQPAGEDGGEKEAGEEGAEGGDADMADASGEQGGPEDGGREANAEGSQGQAQGQQENEEDPAAPPAEEGEEAGEANQQPEDGSAPGGEKKTQMKKKEVLRYVEHFGCPLAALFQRMVMGIPDRPQWRYQIAFSGVCLLRSFFKAERESEVEQEEAEEEGEEEEKRLSEVDVVIHKLLPAAAQQVNSAGRLQAVELAGALLRDAAQSLVDQEEGAGEDEDDMGGMAEPNGGSERVEMLSFFIPGPLRVANATLAERRARAEKEKAAGRCTELLLLVKGRLKDDLGAVRERAVCILERLLSVFAQRIGHGREQASGPFSKRTAVLATTLLPPGEKPLTELFASTEEGEGIGGERDFEIERKSRASRQQEERRNRNDDSEAANIRQRALGAAQAEDGVPPPEQPIPALHLRVPLLIQAIASDPTASVRKAGVILCQSVASVAHSSGPLKMSSALLLRLLGEGVNRERERGAAEDEEGGSLRDDGVLQRFAVDTSYHARRQAILLFDSLLGYFPKSKPVRSLWMNLLSASQDNDKPIAGLAVDKVGERIFSALGDSKSSRTGAAGGSSEERQLCLTLLKEMTGECNTLLQRCVKEFYTTKRATNPGDLRKLYVGLKESVERDLEKDKEGRRRKDPVIWCGGVWVIIEELSRHESKDAVIPVSLLKTALTTISQKQAYYSGAFEAKAAEATMPTGGGGRLQTLDVPTTGGLGGSNSSEDAARRRSDRVVSLFAKIASAVEHFAHQGHLDEVKNPQERTAIYREIKRRLVEFDLPAPLPRALLKVAWALDGQAQLKQMEADAMKNRKHKNQIDKKREGRRKGWIPDWAKKMRQDLNAEFERLVLRLLVGSDDSKGGASTSVAKKPRGTTEVVKDLNRFADVLHHLGELMFLIKGKAPDDKWQSVKRILMYIITQNSIPNNLAHDANPRDADTASQETPVIIDDHRRRRDAWERLRCWAINCWACFAGCEEPIEEVHVGGRTQNEVVLIQDVLRKVHLFEYPNVRIAANSALTDLAEWYPTQADDKIGIALAVSLCFASEPHSWKNQGQGVKEFEREQAVGKMAQLLLGEKLKFSSQDLLFRFTYCISDPQSRIARFVQSFFIEWMKQKDKKIEKGEARADPGKTFRECFLDLVCWLNGWDKHPKYNAWFQKKPKAERERFNLRTNPQRRRAIYVFMLNAMSDLHKLYVTRDLVGLFLNVWGDWYSQQEEDGTVMDLPESIDSPAGSALADALNILSCKEAKLTYKNFDWSGQYERKQENARDEKKKKAGGQAQDAAAQAEQAEKDAEIIRNAEDAQKLVQAKLKESAKTELAERILPTLLHLKKKMKTKLSSFQGVIRRCIASLCYEFKDDFKTLLAADPTLKEELDYDYEKEVFKNIEKQGRIPLQLEPSTAAGVLGGPSGALVGHGFSNRHQSQRGRGGKEKEKLRRSPSGTTAAGAGGAQRARHSTSELIHSAHRRAPARMGSGAVGLGSQQTGARRPLSLAADRAIRSTAAGPMAGRRSVKFQLPPGPSSSSSSSQEVPNKRGEGGEEKDENENENVNRANQNQAGEGGPSLVKAAAAGFRQGQGEGAAPGVLK
uniref:Condensin complex subunit 1 C-terminal domain-containing protein n=2 Tax=Chromera velia CCMP2878 TaxID=1169474 RepID=A0A0K6SAC0_9ALVE|eukprot:Cvel_40.t2-p1 / transcript=Cvel_40.t2 / gene=Cvel_40 / organism=Chromera_velia_CCMP2878 / gene_product=hypothetical protein / transcript_product=hypothetical protein / location=Cvel_scaffold5:227684-240819(+) / protein_length=2131 / sequence_SO=supercontig / SO=protein_coding / is_pseudo=false